jgi:hypothetical protein
MLSRRSCLNEAQGISALSPNSTAGAGSRSRRARLLLGDIPLVLFLTHVGAFERIEVNLRVVRLHSPNTAALDIFEVDQVWSNADWRDSDDDVQPPSIVEVCSDLESGHRRPRSASVCDRRRGGFGSSLSRGAVVGSQRRGICAAPPSARAGRKGAVETKDREPETLNVRRATEDDRETLQRSGANGSSGNHLFRRGWKAPAKERARRSTLRLALVPR